MLQGLGSHAGRGMETRAVLAIWEQVSKMRRRLETYPRFFQPPSGSYFLFGPRGTGKSSWLRAHCRDAVWIDLLLPETLHKYSARPGLLREELQSSKTRRVVVIDEVQRAPELLSVVHSLRESDKHLQFVLTGSSSRKLKRTGVDLLGGRATVCTLHPFMAAELGRRFHLESALELGLLPLVVAADDPAATLRGYQALYLKEEVQQEGLVRNIGAFARFLEAISFSHGSILNLSKVARECAVDRKTVEGFVSIAEDLLLCTRLDVFTRRAQRATSAHPKFYFFDAGIFRAARPAGPLDRASEITGAALEGLVLQHLRAWNAYRGERNRIYYWRTRHGVEVDFIVYGPDGFWAIEVKNGKRVDSADVRSLRAFREDYPKSHVLLLYRGSDRLLVADVPCVPCDEFLAGVHPSHADISA
jgi:predicted AAA+ superfamily ATPase